MTVSYVAGADPALLDGSAGSGIDPMSYPTSQVLGTNAANLYNVTVKDLAGNEWIRDAQPDLLILDLWMETPDTGNAVLGLLQTDPATRTIPVIVFSGYLQSWQLEAVLPIERWIATLAKPASLEQILHLVTAVLPTAQRPQPASVHVTDVNDLPH